MKTITVPVLLQFDARGSASAAVQSQAVIGLVNEALSIAGINCEPAILWAPPTPEHAALFATMPEPPDDMSGLDGLQAYAEAVLHWRASVGFPSVYDGPIGG